MENEVNLTDAEVTAFMTNPVTEIFAEALQAICDETPWTPAQTRREGSRAPLTRLMNAWLYCITAERYDTNSFLCEQDNDFLCYQDNTNSFDAPLHPEVARSLDAADLCPGVDCGHWVDPDTALPTTTRDTIAI